MSTHLLTGAGSGIGAVLAERLLERGDELVLVARNQERAHDLREDVPGATVLVADLADPASLHFRTQTMVRTASKVEWTVVRNELESLQLEYTWIKLYDPRFNIKYRDDKSYPWVAVTWSEEFPRVFVTRDRRLEGVDEPVRALALYGMQRIAHAPYESHRFVDLRARPRLRHRA